MADPTQSQSGARGDSAVHAELHERKKELSFLHHAMRLINMQGDPRDIARAVLELLPSAMCHPELASARLSLGELEVFTRAYQQGEPCIRVEFDVDATTQGLVEVCYAAGSGSLIPVFLDEERQLLESFAQLLKTYFERVQADAARKRLLEVEASKQSAISESSAKDRFLSTVSHELRSSLHVMLGWIEVLQQDSTSADTRARGLQILARNVTLQARLIEDLMDLSRIVSGKLELCCTQLDLAELVSFAIDATRPAAEAKQLTLTADVHAVGHVLGDQQRLQQVVYNLLGNAVKFTPPAGRIHVGLTRRDGRAFIVVQDTGIGIDDALLPYVFERFRQADVARKGRSSGLGLGLPIARHLVELHQGEISVRSNRPDPGTTFEISLPLL